VTFVTDGAAIGLSVIGLSEMTLAGGAAGLLRRSRP